MFALRRPTDRDLARLLAACAHLEPNDALIETADLAAPPDGFDLDEYGAVLGRGPEAWARARAALDDWAMYPKWVSVHPNGDVLATTSAFVAVVRHFGFHSLLPCRVREAFDTPGPVRRYGFAFLTLNGHAERGVERFTVSWDEESDDVRYDVTAISRPAGLARLAAPVARALQTRFQRETVASMRRHVGAGGAHGGCGP